jgi:hypothetical protein
LAARSVALNRRLDHARGDIEAVSVRIALATVTPAASGGPPRQEFCWYLHAQTLSLYLGDPMTGAWTYAVDLERCATSAQLADWIFQVASKTWATDAVIGELVRALNDVLDPQATLCSFGQERGPLDVAALLTHRTRPHAKGRYAQRLRSNLKPSPKERGLPRLEPVALPNVQPPSTS